MTIRFPLRRRTNRTLERSPTAAELRCALADLLNMPDADGTARTARARLAIKRRARQLVGGPA